MKETPVKDPFTPCASLPVHAIRAAQDTYAEAVDLCSQMELPYQKIRLDLLPYSSRKSRTPNLPQGKGPYRPQEDALFFWEGAWSRYYIDTNRPLHVPPEAFHWLRTYLPIDEPCLGCWEWEGSFFLDLVSKLITPIATVKIPYPPDEERAWTLLYEYQQYLIRSRAIPLNTYQIENKSNQPLFFHNQESSTTTPDDLFSYHVRIGPGEIYGMSRGIDILFGTVWRFASHPTNQDSVLFTCDGNGPNRIVTHSF